MTPDAPPRTADRASFLETWGPPAFVTIFGLFFLQMAVLTPLVRYGVDLAPMLDWIDRTFGVQLGLEGAGTSWGVALVGAYAITRALKPLSLAAVVVLTPIVARVGRPFFGERGPEAPSADAERR